METVVEELFVVLFLDRKHRYIKKEIVALFSFRRNRVILGRSESPKDIVKSCLKFNHVSALTTKT